MWKEIKIKILERKIVFWFFLTEVSLETKYNVSTSYSV